MKMASRPGVRGISDFQVENTLGPEDITSGMQIEIKVERQVSPLASSMATL